MSTGLLEQRANYPRSQYEYGFGGHGTTDADNNGRKEIDCSNLLNRMLQDAGYNIPYKTTAQLSDSGRPTPKVTMTVNDFRAYDVCPEVSGTPPAGKLSTGTKLEVLEQKNVGNVTYARGKILSGAVKDGARKTREAGAEVWFAYLKDGAPYQNSEPKDIWKADKIVERLRPNYWQTAGAAGGGG